MALRIEKMDPQKTALLVVDMQNDFVAQGAPIQAPMAYEMLPTLQRVLDFSREKGISVIYTRHVHRPDGSDMGLFREIYPGVAELKALIDGQPGSEIFPDVQPKENEHVIKKHRYSAFYGTDLDIILRTKGIENLVITGATTEDCCFDAARDAMYRGYRVAFLSDVTGTYDYPDIGFGAVPAEDLHRVMLTVLGVTTAHVMTSEEFMEKVVSAVPSQS